MSASPASAAAHLAGAVSQSTLGAPPAPAPRQTPPANAFSCTDCGLVFDTITSLDVHLRYHKDNLLSKWATQQQQQQPQQVQTGAANNTTGQSNNTGNYDESPPLNNNLNSITKPKQEAQTSPVGSPLTQPDSSSYFHTGYPPQPNNSYGNNSYGNHNGFQLSYTGTQQHQGYKGYPPIHNTSNGNEFNGYQQQQQQQHQHQSTNEHQPNSLPSSSGSVEDSNNAHSEILDLDSHKVHQVYPPSGEQEEEASTTTSPNASTPNGFAVHHHHTHLAQAQQAYGSQSYPPPPWEYQQQQSPMPPPPRYQDTTTPPPPPQHQQPQQHTTPSNQQQQSGKQSSGGASWKSNEARRPKTYNCTACNKWFTSSGHLKRHYNTTLHKNAVKSSGCVDPAKMPVSTHHHPARSNNNSNNLNNSIANDIGTQPVKRMRKDMQSTSPPSPLVMTQQTHSPLTQQNQLTLGMHPQPQQQHLMHDYTLASPHLQHPGLIATHHPHLHQATGNGAPAIDNYGGYLTNSALPGDHAAAVAAAAAVSATSPNGSPLYAQTRVAVVDSIPNTIIGSQVPTTQTNVLPAFPTAFAYVEGPNRVYAPWFNNNVVSTNQMMTSTNTTENIIKNNEFFNDYYQNNDRVTQTYQEQQNQYQYDNYINQDSNSFKQEPEEIYQQQYRSPEYILPNSPSNDLVISQQDPSIYSANQELTNDFKTTTQEMFTQTQSPENITLNNLAETNDIKIKQEPIKTGFETHFQSDEDSFLNNSESMTAVKIEDSSESNNFKQFPNPSPRSDDESSSLSSSCKSDTTSRLSIESTPADSSRDPHNSEITSTKTAPTQTLHSDSSGGEDNTVSSTAPPVHRCNDCHKVFNKACYLTQHNRCFHTGDKPFKCPRCGKRFPEEVAYQEHVSKHAGDKPHKCHLCPKQFNHKTDLRRHLCLHSGEKPYSCDTCGKGFIRKDHMVKHVDTHRRNRRPTATAASATALAPPPPPPPPPQQTAPQPRHPMLMATS